MTRYNSQSDLVSTQTMEPGIAILVDGENVSCASAAKELGRAIGQAPATVRRLYGNVALMPQWIAAAEFYAVHTNPGKNSADMRMAIDAVHLSHAGGIGTFVLVTSDGDFSHLAHHLRERHFRVFGVGEAKAPDAFRKACDRFFELEPQKPAVEVQTGGAPKLTPTEVCLRDAILTVGTPHGLPMKHLGPLMGRQNIMISALPEKKWRKFLENRPKLFACDPTGANARVRWVGPRD